MIDGCMKQMMIYDGEKDEIYDDGIMDRWMDGGRDALDDEGMTDRWMEDL